MRREEQTLSLYMRMRMIWELLKQVHGFWVASAVRKVELPGEIRVRLETTFILREKGRIEI